MNTTHAPTYGDTNFSRLEASLVTTNVAKRQNSIEMKHLYRHGVDQDVNTNELDFKFSTASGCAALGDLRSLQDVFPVVQYNDHLQNPQNFAEQTQIQCFEADRTHQRWHSLDAAGLSDVLDVGVPAIVDYFQQQTRHIQTAEAVQNRNQPSPKRLLTFFVPLIPAKDTSFGSKIALTQTCTERLFEVLHISPLFLLNLIGRPDYWAPQTRFQSDEKGTLEACDFFCQHPRWNLHFQGAPLSVYMRYTRKWDLTTYIIAHKEGDTSVHALQSILRLAGEMSPSRVFSDDPFDIAVTLSTLSFEASKFHVKKFQRFMWTQINMVDDHLAGLKGSDRAKLGDLTKQLQIISQNADSHLANADVAIITAEAIRMAHAKLRVAISSSVYAHQRAHDAIEYVIKSMEKQKIWFLNYKGRKDSTMSLVYNLVTQQDAASNIQLSVSMKKDSTSMNAIAALTMVFLPGTFVASVLDAGIFTAENGSNKIQISGIWWVWIVITVPLTALTVMCWWIYKLQKHTSADMPLPGDELRGSVSRRPRLANFSSYSRPRRTSEAGP